MAAGSSAAVRTTAQPSADPLWVGLTIIGSPSRATSASITAAAPSSRKVWWGRLTESGVAIPAVATMDLATGLLNATRQAAGPEPT